MAHQVINNVFTPDVEKVIIKGDSNDIQVPFNKINLSDSSSLLTSTVEGICENNKLRQISLDYAPYVQDGKAKKVKKTLLERAKEGEITKHMKYVSIRESYSNDLNRNFKDETVLEEIVKGEAVIPCNVNHEECESMIIGRRFSVKINANIGASSMSSNFDEEIKKLKLALKYGADTVMDLSTGIDNLQQLRSAIIHASPVPIGTVPVYEALDRAHGDISLLNFDMFRQTVIDQARAGVDYFTIHAGLKSDLLPYAAKRKLGIVSRGGSIMASAMLRQQCENMAFEHFDDLLEICHDYDVALSLGDGLRPGCIADACDKAQYGELEYIGELAKRCFDAGVQCFIEGPGHVNMNKVYENQALQEKFCNRAPFYTLGPLVTDIAPGYDHITSAIGGSMIASYGTAMLCYVTPSEHLALPEEKDVKDGLITYKLAAHAADLAKGLKGAQLRDDAMAMARADFRWFDQFALSLDPEHAYSVWAKQMGDECSKKHDVAFCSMCGPRFCPIRLNKKLKAAYNEQ
ncbi:phosphomethylpyrimidine synthase [Succinivibrio sp.]|uniref:phosphomethylpyrimidine synthase n=1 Tax=Succinivibrio sp. TaxID=2053619 RepID=UPI00386A4693